MVETPARVLAEGRGFPFSGYAGTNRDGWRFLPSKPENEYMLRLMIALGAVYAAFRLGRDVGRGEARMLFSGPVDYERRPSARSREELGLWTK
jgi:hypothetical protein